MTYWYQRTGDDCFRIYNVETRSALGCVTRQDKNWRVEDGDDVFVAAVSLEATLVAPLQITMRSIESGDLTV